MKLTVHVKPKARKTVVQLLPDGTYKIAVTALADKGKANQAVLQALADYLDVAPSSLTILSGHTARTKIILVS